MPSRVQKSAEPTPSKVDQTPHSEGGEQADLSYTDDLLDEIDGVLEENAQEFVANYIQKGGE